MNVWGCNAISDEEADAAYEAFKDDGFEVGVNMDDGRDPERTTVMSRTVIVPNVLADQIYAAIDRELENAPDAAPNRENFYLQLLNFYDENGYIPSFSLHKSRPETPADDPDHLNPEKGGNRASDDYWGDND